MVASASENTCTPALKRKQTLPPESDEDDVLPMIEYIDESVASPAMSTITFLPSTSCAISPTPSKQARIDVAFSKLKSFQDGGSETTEITNKLLFMIAKDNMPLQTVEREGFKTFVKAIAPLYKLPCTKSITNMIQEKYEALAYITKQQLSMTEHLSLTTDIWTNTLNVKSHLGLTSHLILHDQHKSITIGGN